ncbi:ankyrin repeat containing protein yar1 [Verticillium dahliae]
MAPNLTEDEVDDLIYFARAGEQADLAEALATLSARESVAPGVILTAARDESKATCLHMAAGNGNLGQSSRAPIFSGNTSLRLHSENGRNDCTREKRKSWMSCHAMKSQY